MSETKRHQWGTILCFRKTVFSGGGDGATGILNSSKVIATCTDAEREKHVRTPSKVLTSSAVVLQITRGASLGNPKVTMFRISALLRLIELGLIWSLKSTWEKMVLLLEESLTTVPFVWSPTF